MTTTARRAAIRPGQTPPVVLGTVFEESVRWESDPLTTPNAQAGSPPAPQPVVQALTRAAIFLVGTINPGSANGSAVRSLCGNLPALLRSVGFRDIEGNLSCVMGIGSDAWDRLFGQPRPSELHPFREIKAGSVRQFRSWMKCTAFAISTIAISSVLSMARRIHPVKRRSTLHTWAWRTPRSRAAAM